MVISRVKSLVHLLFSSSWCAFVCECSRNSVLTIGLDLWKWKYFSHKTICHLWDLNQCFLWNITLHAALTGRAKNEHQIWFMHMYKGSNLPLLGCYYFLVYVTRSERLGKGCPTLHTVHNRYRTVFSKRSQRIWNLLNISITKPTFFILGRRPRYIVTIE